MSNEQRYVLNDLQIICTKAGQQKADFQMYLVVTGFAKIRDTIDGSSRNSYRTRVVREMRTMFEIEMHVRKFWTTLCNEMSYCSNACCDK